MNKNVIQIHCSVNVDPDWPSTQAQFLILAPSMIYFDTRVLHKQRVRGERWGGLFHERCEVVTTTVQVQLK